MNTRDLTRIISKVDKENSIFANKAYLDVLTIPAKIIGREKQAEDLVRYLLGYKQGSVVPLISVYGRSGSGKSTIVKFVCENLDDISHCFVNLRKAKTVFGCANLILAELGQPNLKSAQGINLVLENIGNSIESVLIRENKKFFVLVLDESDVLFYDRRGKPSDFIYKLIVLEEHLRKKDLLLCVICISNNVLYDYDLDDRVRSRIGTTEVFFEPYYKDDVIKILQGRAQEAFAKKIDNSVLEFCAKQSSAEHGDARRAIDLLRVAAQIASQKGEVLGKSHVDLAAAQLQKDRLANVLSTASYHFKLVCGSLARITYLTGQEWHSTYTLYNQYRKIISKDSKPLTYRRVSEILTELENTGLVILQTSSRGRHGYGTQYKLTVPPDVIGKICFEEWWQNIVKEKQNHERAIETPGLAGMMKRSDPFYSMKKSLDVLQKKQWDGFVGS